MEEHMRYMQEGMFTPRQVEFIAEDELISIEPLQNIAAIPFIRGQVGPFRVGIPAEVPLWLAVLLKKRNKCKIQYPDWLSADALRATRDEEKISETCTPLPFHYLEISQQLLSAAPDNMQDTVDIRTLLEDIHALRLSKIRKLVLKLDECYVPCLPLENLCAMELNSMRSFLSGMFDMMYVLSEEKEDADSQLSQYSAFETPAASSAATSQSGSWQQQQRAQQDRLRQESGRRNLRPAHRA
eukprot:TRINITY_DN7566_c0_g1_i2.p1 TRINITY_DN7566_c0_g1~~TRINITY_DN7566_c0_g1_i2.p1  ORF type:complete len:241 (+),score=50.72 TRINITY_DN7566_c0_g1_i2:346-1068(+)